MTPKRNIFLLVVCLLTTRFALGQKASYDYCFNKGEYRWTKSVAMPYRDALIGEDETTDVLLVFLHGNQERGADNEAPIAGAPLHNLLAFLTQEKVSARVLVPQCSVDRRWNEIRPVLGNYMTEIVYKLIKEYVTKYNLTRIYIVGESMGGVGAWRMLCDYPHLFDAALIVAACPPQKSSAKKLSKTPINLVLGETDEYASKEKAEPFVQAIQNKGGHVVLDVLPATGHLYTTVLGFDKKHFVWLFQQHRAR